jgi:hypothetical protein
VVTFVEMILLSVDYCFLIGSLTTLKSFPYNTGLFSAVVTGTNFLSSTGAERHLKANGFVTHESCLCQAHLEVVSVSHASRNEMASHVKNPSGPHRPSSFLRYFTSIEMVIFFVALAVSAVCACLFVWGWCPWRCQSTCLRCLSASVAHVLFFLLLAALFFCKFCC